EVQFHLVDSIGKKLKIIDAVAKSISLDNITTQHTRVEEIKNRKFDFAVSRAVASLKDLWQWSRPLLNNSMYDKQQMTNGLICLKGGNLTQEIGESRVQPKIIEITTLFEEDYFKEKYLLYVSQPAVNLQKK
ncbi:MAG TPA: RsmG family class I SAM-dependent methyltransferase, partial [Chitinophagaceae bacterium]|nr:RsmG family class I SAM-dependent methyltransferase [Chitinophagaceae bacterium]